MTKPRTHLPPPGIDAAAFARVAQAWLGAIARKSLALTEPEREAFIFWLKRHPGSEIIAAIAQAPAPLTLEGVNKILERVPRPRDRGTQ